MHPTRTAHAVVLPVHPEYVAAILDGRKRAEFRKRPLPTHVTHVVIYATAPVHAVTAAFAVDGQTSASPVALWDAFEPVAGIARDRFFAYYFGRDAGTAIGIGTVYRAPDPILLHHIGVRVRRRTSATFHPQRQRPF